MFENKETELSGRAEMISTPIKDLGLRSETQPCLGRRPMTIPAFDTFRRATRMAQMAAGLERVRGARHVRKLGKKMLLSRSLTKYIVCPGLRSRLARLLPVVWLLIFSHSFPPRLFLTLVAFRTDSASSTPHPSQDASLHTSRRFEPCCSRLSAGHQLLDVVNPHLGFTSPCSDLLGPMYARATLSFTLLLTLHRCIQRHLLPGSLRQCALP